MEMKKSKWSHVRVEASEDACLAQLAKDMGVSKAAWVRIAIREAWRKANPPGSPPARPRP